MTLTVLLFWIYIFWCCYLFHNGFPSIGKFWSWCCLSFHWLCIKLKRVCLVSSHDLWLFLCGLDLVFVIIWEMFPGRISLNSVLLLLLVNFVSEFRLELMYIYIYIPHHKYQVKPHSSLWFSAGCAAVIVHRNHFFCLYQQNNSSEPKVKFRQASNHYKSVLEAVKLAYGNRTKESITSQKLLLNC